MTGLMFHHAHGSGHPQVQGSWSADEFRAYIQQHRNHLLNARDYLDIHRAGTMKPNDRVITFDDGLRCQYDVFLPVLNEFALTAFWFVPTAPLIGVASRLEAYRWTRNKAFGDVDGFYRAWREYIPATSAPGHYLADREYLSQADRDFRFWRDEVAEPVEYSAVMDHMIENLACSYHRDATAWHTFNLTPYHVRTLAQAGHVIGTHSHSHPTKLSALTKEAQEIEYATSTFIVEQLTGTRPVAMSHPNNQYTPHGLAYLKSLGYTLGFRATHDSSFRVGIAPELEVSRLNSADIRPSTLVHGRYHDARMQEDHA